MSLKLKFKPPRIPLFRLDEGDMRELGETVLESNMERAVRGVNAMDAAAKPLTPGHIRRKKRKGRPPIRDLRFEGDMWQDAAVLEASDELATIAFSSGFQQLKANVNQQIDPFFGVSPTDDERGSEKAQQLVDEKVAEFNRGSF